jgi:hypothetical protein
MNLKSTIHPQNMVLNAFTPNIRKGMTLCTKIFTKDDSLWVGIGYENGGITFWDLKNSSKPVFEFVVQNEPVLSFDLNADASIGIAGTAGQDISCFSVDLSKGEASITDNIGINHPGISEVMIRPDQLIFATAGWDHRVRIFQTKKFKPLAILKGHTLGVNCVHFSPTQKSWMASGSKDKKIMLWDIY